MPGNRGREYGIGFQAGFFISKIITQQYRFQEKNRKFKRFWWLAPEKTGNGTFLGN